MKEIIESFLKTANERIKNPFIGAFISSWIIFNWKPILFLIFSFQNIESKLFYIQKQFSDIDHLIYLPLISTIFYILILPLLNLLFEILLKSPTSKRKELVTENRKQAIEHEKVIAIEEIKLEETKTEYRGLKSNNKLIEELQQKCIKLEEEINYEKGKAKSEIENLKNEITQKEEIFKLEKQNFDTANFTSRSELIDLRKKIQTLEDTNKNLNEKISDSQNNIESLILFKNGERFIEQIKNGEKSYFNFEKNQVYSPEDIINRMNNNEYVRYSSK